MSGTLVYRTFSQIFMITKLLIQASSKQQYPRNCNKNNQSIANIKGETGEMLTLWPHGGGFDNITFNAWPIILAVQMLKAIVEMDRAPF